MPMSSDPYLSLYLAMRPASWLDLDKDFALFGFHA